LRHVTIEGCGQMLSVGPPETVNAELAAGGVALGVVLTL